jgi:heptosyltransferase-3
LTMSEEILVIHPGALGDVLLSFPALVALKGKRGTRLAMLCKDQVGKVACDLQVAAVHFPVESARFCGLFAKEMSHDMKAFIDCYDTIVSIGFSEDISHHIGQHHRGRTYGITPRPPAGEEVHVAGHITRQFEIKGLLRKSGDCRRWEAKTEDGKSDVGARVSSSGHPGMEETKGLREKDLVLIHPGAGSPRKRWALDNFMTVALAMRDRNSANVVFLLGPAESDLLPLVKKQVEGKCPIHAIEDLSEVVALMKATRCFIGNDSGLAHLAAMMGVPTVAIFGPSSPKRWRPLGKAVKVLRGVADCAPCFETEKANCDAPQCLSGVSLDRVLEAAKGLV